MYNTRHSRTNCLRVVYFFWLKVKIKFLEKLLDKLGISTIMKM